MAYVHSTIATERLQEVGLSSQQIILVNDEIFPR